MPIVLRSGILNNLQSSGPVQACTVIALPFSFYPFFASVLESLTFLLCSVMEIMVITSVFDFHLQFQNVAYPLVSEYKIGE
jgi:hypothetical protein